MPIVAGTLVNVYTSLDAYLQTHLVYADSTPVSLRLHGQRRFVPPPDDPWVEAHYEFLELQSQFMNRLTRTSTGISIIGTERLGYIQFNCYQRARIFSARYTTAMIRDLVMGIFGDGENIPIYDYAHIDINPTPELQGGLLIDGSQAHVQDMALYSGVTQVVIQVYVRWIELYTRSV